MSCMLTLLFDKIIYQWISKEWDTCELKMRTTKNVSILKQLKEISSKNWI